MEVYHDHCDEDGIYGLAIEEMPNTAQEIKEKQFITDILNNQRHLTFTHLLNGDKLHFDPTGLEAPEFPNSLSKEQTDAAIIMATQWLT